MIPAGEHVLGMNFGGRFGGRCRSSEGPWFRKDSSAARFARRFFLRNTVEEPDALRDRPRVIHEGSAKCARPVIPRRQQRLGLYFRGFSSTHSVFPTNPTT
jgi:hypothetical protein